MQKKVLVLLCILSSFLFLLALTACSNHSTYQIKSFSSSSSGSEKKLQKSSSQSSSSKTDVKGSEEHVTSDSEDKSLVKSSDVQSAFIEMTEPQKKY